MLEGLTPPKSRAVYCRVDDLAKGMTDDDRKIFLDAVDDGATWSANSLSGELRKRGVSIADTTITKHRTKTCACFRS